MIEEDAEYYEAKLRLLVYMLKDVEKDSYQTMKYYLDIISKALILGCSLPPDISGYIGNSLLKISEGENNACAAFGVKRKRGEKDHSAAHAKSYALADCVERMRHHDQITKEQAIGICAPMFLYSIDGANDAWKKHHKKIKKSIELEKEFMSEGVLPALFPK